MSVSSTTNNRVLFNDGEGLDLTDLNDLSAFDRAFMIDGLLACNAQTDLTDDLPSASYLFAPTAAQAYAKPTGTAKQITNAAGWIGQWTSAGAADGLTPKFLFFKLAAGDLLTTLDAGGGNNRWDGLFVKITEVDADSQDRDFKDATTGALTSQTLYKKRRTQLDFSVVKGTEATNPSFPSTPSGYVPYAYIYMPTGFSSVLTTAKISDMRVPMRFGSVTLYAKDISILNAFSLNGSGTKLTGAASAAAIAFFNGPQNARILRATVATEDGTGLAALPQSMTLINGLTHDIGSVTHKSMDIAGAVGTMTYLTPLASTGNAGAWWSGGVCAGPAQMVTDGVGVMQTPSGLYITTNSSSAIFDSVRFDYAY